MQIKRRFVRWQLNWDAKMKLEGAEATASCKLKDISFQGAQLSLPMKLPKDTFLRLNIVLSEEFILDVEVWVVWHKTIAGLNYYGVYFTKIKDPDKEKIYRFLRCFFTEEVNRKWAEGMVRPEGGEKMEDRRVFDRFKAKMPVRYIELTEGKEGTAETENISAKGIGLLGSKELAAHTPVEMWLGIPDKGEPLYTRGEVIWSKRSPIQLDKFNMGVSLGKADLMGLARVLRAV